MTDDTITEIAETDEGWFVHLPDGTQRKINPIKESDLAFGNAIATFDELSGDPKDGDVWRFTERRGDETIIIELRVTKVSYKR